MNNQEELILKWDTFLEKIQTRFEDSLNQAEEACVDQLIESDYDYNTVFRSWQGMKSQIQNIGEKVDETWEQKVEPQMRAAGDFWMDESRKASELTDSLSEQIQRFQFVLEGKLSKMFYDHVMEVSQKDFNCSQCDGNVEIAKDLFRAQYVTCEYCSTVNEFTPTTKFVEVGSVIVDNIAALRCLDSYDAKNSAYEKLRDHRPPAPDAAWDTYKAAYFNYYETYFKERIKLKPSAKERFEDDMDRKRKEYEEFENIQRHNKYGQA
jgi:hypothetical protein